MWVHAKCVLFPLPMLWTKVKSCPWLTGLKAVPGRENGSADTLLVSVSGLSVLDR